MLASRPARLFVTPTSDSRLPKARRRPQGRRRALPPLRHHDRPRPMSRPRGPSRHQDRRRGARVRLRRPSPAGAPWSGGFATMVFAAHAARNACGPARRAVPGFGAASAASPPSTSDFLNSMTHAQLGALRQYSRRMEADQHFCKSSFPSRLLLSRQHLRMHRAGLLR